MKSLSLWARHNPISARLIIILSHLVLALIAFFLANKLSQNGFFFSQAMTFVVIIVFVVTAFCYPRQMILSKSGWIFTRRKIFDFAVAALSFSMILVVVNQLNRPFNSQHSAFAAVVIKDPAYKNPEAEKLLKAFKAGEKTKFTRKEKRIIKQEFKYQLGKYIKATVRGDKKDAGDTGLIILACIAAVGLLFLVASLACTLSCNGSDAAAIIVGVAGTALIVWLLIITIRSINRKSQKKKESKQ